MFGLLNKRNGERVAKAAAAAVSTSHAPPVENEPGSRGADAGRTRAAAADSIAAALRWVRTGGPAWRFGRHPADRSPWYLMIGLHNAGKSTMLRASGHRPGQRDVAHEPVWAQAPLQWWFRERTIWFETTVIEAGDAAHVAGWHASMRRLRRARPRCPADGIVVVVSVEQLMNDDEAAREQCASALRAYIDMAYRAFKRRVPVYVLVAQCDRLAGFNEFVSDLAEDVLDRPWGIVFPTASDPSDEASAAWFAREFEALVSRARSQVIGRMPVRTDSRRATMIYRFPTSLEALRVPLERFLDEAFAPSPELLEPIWLRSVNLAAVPRRDAQTGDDAGPLSVAVSARERACFTHGWLHDVLLAERGLARSRHAMPRPQMFRLGAAAAACVALAMCLGLGLASAYRRGAANLEAAIASTAEFARAARTGIDTGRPSTMLPALEAVRALPCAHRSEGLAGRWLEQLTLAREPHWAAACRDAYRAALQATILPYVLARTTAALRDGNGSPSSQYDALRVYLMLGDKAHYDRAAVSAWLSADAQGAAQSPLSARERSAWLAHAAAWAEAAASEPDAPLDAALVAQARTRLRAQPEAQSVFDDVMRALNEPAIAPLSVADMAGPGAALVFYRRSGGALSEGVSGAYTLDGARRYLALRDAAIARARRERWVLGADTGEPPPARLAPEVDRLYVERYLTAWDALLADVALRPLPAADDGAAAVKLLASATSPLRAYVIRAANETTWVAASRDASAQAAQSSWFGRVGPTVRLWFGMPASTPAKAPPPLGQLDDESAARLDRHFDALHRLVAGGAAGEPSLLDQAQAQLKEVAVYLQAAGVARASGLATPPDDALRRLVADAATLPAPLGAMLEELGEAGAAAAQSAARARIDERWQADAAGFCHAAADGRYPFVANAAVDTTLDDFARLFAPGGLLDAFFQANLKPYVDTSTTPWTWRAKLAPPGMSIASLGAFERAARIRQAFFPGHDKTMNVRFTLTGRDTDAALPSFALTFGEQTLNLTNDTGAAKAFQWPDGSAAPVARIDYAVAGADGPQHMEDHGVWSLFRLLDRGTLDALGPDRFTLTFALDGHRVALDLAASSVVNPFALSALRSFRCPSRM